eukprot:CAMPEP_0185743348 /NCGR_PEP_ID=MMETSP1174-20130828/1042_1 /TAXON_ID=35687 /ORGANISM="Dictyocha speculum, Strain CCMP1381" /LENGTH=146 /DNA_ID=CAMNT_0028415955 /DNA_START=48 /DNA_END=484 /DNA_ORIENTATION=-
MRVLALLLSLASFGVNADRRSLAQPRFCSSSSTTAWVAPRRPENIQPQTRRHRLGHLSALPEGFKESESLGKFSDLLNKAKADAAEQYRDLDMMKEKQKVAELAAIRERDERIRIAAEKAAEEAATFAREAAKKAAAEKAAAEKEA